MAEKQKQIDVINEHNKTLIKKVIVYDLTFLSLLSSYDSNIDDNMTSLYFV